MLTLHSSDYNSLFSRRCERVSSFIFASAISDADPVGDENVKQRMKAQFYEQIKIEKSKFCRLVFICEALQL